MANFNFKSILKFVLSVLIITGLIIIVNVLQSDAADDRSRENPVLLDLKFRPYSKSPKQGEHLNGSFPNEQDQTTWDVNPPIILTEKIEKVTIENSDEVEVFSKVIDANDPNVVWVDKDLERGKRYGVKFTFRDHKSKYFPFYVLPTKDEEILESINLSMEAQQDILEKYTDIINREFEGDFIAKSGQKATLIKCLLKDHGSYDQWPTIQQFYQDEILQEPNKLADLNFTINHLLYRNQTSPSDSSTTDCQSS